MSKFKVGDRVVITKPHDEEEYPYWCRGMDCMTYGPVIVEGIGAEDQDCVPCFRIGEYIYAESWAEIASESALESEDPTTLTRRDRFAMAALTGILPGCSGLSKDEFLTVAGAAYDFADAMDLARNKEGGE